MFERMKVVPVSRLVQIGVLWFIVGAFAGLAAAGIVIVATVDPVAPPPVVVQAGAQGTVVQFTAVLKGAPARCTLSMHGKTNAWSVSC